MNPLKIFCFAFIGALMLLLAAFVGAQIQEVVAERNYYKAKAERLEMNNALQNHHPQF